MSFSAADNIQKAKGGNMLNCLPSKELALCKHALCNVNKEKKKTQTKQNNNKKQRKQQQQQKNKTKQNKTNKQGS